MRRERRVVDGHEVVVHRRDGAGDAPPVLLVHGIGVSSGYFRRLVRSLDPYRAVLAPDLVGFGASPRAREPLTIGEHADVLARLLDDVAPGTRHLLVGHSMGAQVVTELAARRPDLCAGLVLLSPVVDPSAPSPARQGGRLLRDAVREPVSGVAEQVRAYLRTGPRWYLRTARRMCDYRIEQRIGGTRAPVVVVRGTRDPVTPAAFARALADTARGRVVEVPGAAHLVMWSRPDAVAALCAAGTRATP